MGIRDWLEWEESTFRVLLAGWRRVRSRDEDPSDRPGNVSFDDHALSLSVLAQTLLGEPVRVRRGPGAGGPRGDDLVLPARLCLGGDPELSKLGYRVQVALSVGLLRHAAQHGAPDTSRYEGALDALRVTREVVDALAEELPRFRESHDLVIKQVLEAREMPDLSRLRGLEAELERARRDALAGATPWTDAERCERLRGARSGRHRSPPISIWGEWLSSPGEAAIMPPGAEAEPDSNETPTTEAEAPDVGALRRVTLEGTEEEDQPPAIAFEQAETLDQHRGGRRDIDGSDELDAHLDALEQVDLGDLFRSNQGSSSLLKADLELGLDVADADDEQQGGITYDEWDARKRRYRKDWCRVRTGSVPPGNASWAVDALHRQRDLVRRLRLQLEAHRAGLRPVSRQLDGEDIDLGAAIDDHVARRAGRGDDPRLYIRQRKRRRDFATLVLIDVSASTDSWVDGHRILDVAREATLVLGEVADQLGDRVQVYAFASETRNRCHVWEVHGPDQSWREGKLRLAGLEPVGYTRIGPALRHATALLAAEPAERRLLLLISDGKPTDYDRYEGRYGVADVRQAIREAHQLEIHTHALAVDEVARDYLPALFGEGGWHILARPDQLVESLTTVYGRLTAR